MLDVVDGSAWLVAHQIKGFRATQICKADCAPPSVTLCLPTRLGVDDVDIKEQVAPARTIRIAPAGNGLDRQTFFAQS